MSDLSVENYIIIAFSGFTALICLISVIIKAVRSKKIAKCEVLVRLKVSKLFAAIFILFTGGAAAGLWLLGGGIINSAAVTVACTAVIFYTLAYQAFPCAVTREALFAGGKMTEWDKVSDFYLDKCKRRVIFSLNPKGGLSLKGVTEAYGYIKADEEKLEQFLSAHKEKFLKRIIIR